MFSSDALAMYLWHIDDVFIVWDSSRSHLEDFIQLLGDNSFNLAFTMKCSELGIYFLDVWFQKDKSGAPSSGRGLCVFES